MDPLRPGPRSYPPPLSPYGVPLTGVTYPLFPELILVPFQGISPLLLATLPDHPLHFNASSGDSARDGWFGPSPVNLGLLSHAGPAFSGHSSKPFFVPPFFHPDPDGCLEQKRRRLFFPDSCVGLTRVLFGLLSSKSQATWIINCPIYLDACLHPCSFLALRAS